MTMNLFPDESEVPECQTRKSDDRVEAFGRSRSFRDSLFSRIRRGEKVFP